MRQQGFSTVAAIFLVVVLAALGAFMVSLSTTQHAAVTLDLQGVRALAAARSGVEWAAYQAAKNTAGYGCTSGSHTDTLNFTGDLADFTTTITCTSTAYDEAGNTVRVYDILSTATAGTPGTLYFVKREVSAQVAVCTAAGGGAC
ncbi:hypothetical protein [Thiobacter aerophilum]|uniref:MSHA biogenesis protein MshP n=1 Tax=Thiobacter aerophilum TaxID=3121275 RepID=A0ABV0EF55_9BURK